MVMPEEPEFVARPASRREDDRPDVPPLPRWVVVSVLGISTVLAGLALYAEFQHLLGGDVAWLLYLSQRVRGGAVLYRDLLDANPPLIVWAGVPLVAIGERWNIPLAPVYRIAVLLLMLSLSVLWWRLYVRLRPGRSTVLTCVTIAAACLIPLHEFGQRDHLVALLLWSAVLVAALRQEGHSLATATEVSVGLLAALACALKPHYVLVPLGLLYSNRRRPWRDPLMLAGGIALGVYGLLVLTLTPDFLPFIRDFSSDYYQYFHQSIASLLWGSYPARMALGLLLAGGLGVLASEDRRAPGVMLRASALALAVTVAQGKGLGYHYIPPLLSGTLLIVLLLFEPVRSWRLFRLGWWARLAGAMALVVLITLLTFSTVLSTRGIRWGYETRHDALRAVIERTAPKGSLLMLSPIVQDGFPLALTTGIEWRFPAPSVWGLIASGNSTPTPGAHASARMLGLISQAMRGRPDLVLIRRAGVADGIPGEQFDVLDAVQQDLTIRAALAKYRRLPDTVGYAVFLRHNRRGVRP
jgi:hypothetical protein